MLNDGIYTQRQKQSEDKTLTARAIMGIHFEKTAPESIPRLLRIDHSFRVESEPMSQKDGKIHFKDQNASGFSFK